MTERIAIYLRISQEDMDLKSTDKPESQSITNQRNMLTDYVRHNFPGAELIEFCDDGWSGKNFERPSVKELLAQVKSGAIKCIVVKDFSRFGRDYLAVGNYISRVFPFLGIRFISLGDGFDSIRPQDIDSLNTSFKTLIYDLYSRELSRKVRSAKRRKAEKGDWVSGFTPFGYIKDPANINHLIADPVSSKTVQYIFQMAVDGIGSLEITKRLNAEGVPTPMLHKLDIGTCQRFMTCINEDNYWMQNTVAKIIRDERYTGKNIYGRRTRDVIGDPHTLLTARDTWVVVPQSHDVIISQEIYDRAQETMRALREHKCTPRNDRPLRGKVYCGVCGHVMTRSNGKNAFYYCKTPKMSDAYPDHDNSVPEDDLMDAVLSAIRAYAQCAVELNRLIHAQSSRTKTDKKAVLKQLNAAQLKKEQAVKRIQNLYESLVEGSISREDYAAKKQTLTRQSEEYDADILTLEQKLNATDGETANPVIERFKSFAAVDDLTATLTGELLDRIILHTGGVMDIRLNYADELDSLRETFLQK